MVNNNLHIWFEKENASQKWLRYHAPGKDDVRFT